MDNTTCYGCEQRNEDLRKCLDIIYSSSTEEAILIVEALLEAHSLLCFDMETKRLVDIESVNINGNALQLNAECE